MKEYLAAPNISRGWSRPGLGEPLDELEDDPLVQELLAFTIALKEELRAATLEKNGIDQQL